MLQPRPIDEVHIWWFRRSAETAERGGAGLLEGVCACYVAGASTREPVAYHAGGQPFMPHSPLSCSLADSGDLAVVAVAPRTVGVDLEFQRGDVPEPAFLERACTGWQRLMLRRAEPGGREAAFLRYWVRKEALGKALGIGLDLGLRAGRLNLAPRVAGRRHPGVWRVRDLDAEEGYVAAVATGGVTLRTRTIRQP